MPNTLSGLITEKELLDFSQNFAVARNYTGSRYFPDRKTQYIKQEYTRLCANGNLPQVAMVHAYDTEAHIASRVPFERVSVEELLIKEKINDEKGFWCQDLDIPTARADHRNVR